MKIKNKAIVTIAVLLTMLMMANGFSNAVTVTILDKNNIKNGLSSSADAANRNANSIDDKKNSILPADSEPLGERGYHAPSFYANQYTTHDSNWQSYGAHEMRSNVGGAGWIYFQFVMGYHRVVDGTLYVGIYFMDWSFWPWVGGPDIALYNFNSGQWDTIHASCGTWDTLNWAWYQVPNANNYVGPCGDAGQVQAAVGASSSDDCVLDEISITYNLYDRSIIFYTDPTSGDSITFDSSTYTNGQSTTKEEGWYVAHANPPSGYTFNHWTTTGGLIADSPNSQTTNVEVSGDGTLKAWFTPPPLTVTFYTDPTSGDSITFNGNTYTNGQSTTVNAGTYSITGNPPSGYVFSQWTSTCGTVTNPNAQSTSVAVSQTGYLKAWFIIPPVTVTFYTDPTSGDSITFNGNTYTNGQSVSVTPATYSITGNPPSGYVFSHWTSTCGTVTNPNAQSTSVAVSQTGYLKAWFTIIQYTVTFYTDPTSGDSITFNGNPYTNGQSTTVNAGTYSITGNPPSGYVFGYWTSTCGAVTNPNAQSTTVAVSQTGSLKATFTIIQYTVTFYIDPTTGGTITFNGNPYTNGQSVAVGGGTYSITANHATDYVFSSWSSTCGAVANPNQASTTVTVTSTGTLTAHFTYVPPTAQWTIMVYMDGDNNLEGYGIDNFLQMASVGSTSNVNIVVQFDRIPGNDNRYDDWTTTKRYLVTQGMTPNIANAVSDIGEADMGDPSTLVSFVTWAQANYPANHYCVILWDHGAGWKHQHDIGTKGCCDDVTNGDRLTSAELRSAFNTISNNGNNPIDLIGFDCCLMQMIEVEYQIQPYGHYMTASEETIPATGWKYDSTLQVLVGTPSMSPEALGAQFVSDYIASGGGQTLSTVNLQLLNDLRGHVSTLGSLLKNNAYRSQIAQAKSDVEKYDDNDFVDLYHFAQLIYADINNDNVRTTAQSVMNDVNTIVTSENHDGGHTNSHGISIYVPYTAYDTSYGNLQFAKDTLWDEFLNWFYKEPNNPPNKPTNPIPQDGATGVSPSPTLSVLVIDPDNNTMNVSFYDASDNHLIGTDTGVRNNTRASKVWAGLQGNTTYKWYAIANDSNGDFNTSDTWTFTTGTIQHPPKTPDRPSGPQFGGIGKTYSYITSTTDPDGDQVYYMWDWGDGTLPVWIGPYQSGVMCSANHTWTTKSLFQIKVKAKDTSGAESNWSQSLPIIMPKIIAPPIISLLQWLFGRFPHAFPILRQLMGY